MWLSVLGRLFSITKACWGLESCSLYGVERWSLLRGAWLYIEVINCSFNPDLSFWPLYRVWLPFGGGGSTVVVLNLADFLNTALLSNKSEEA